jgi:DNA polymerase-1
MLMLNKLRNEIKPDAIAIAFDVHAPTFRHAAFKEYKAGRKSMPEELACQIPILKELLSLLGYTLLECEGFEADDILGTLTKACEKGNHYCVIATGDRDSLQLVSDLVSVRITTTKCGKPDVTLYDEERVIEEYGIKPKQLVDIKALQGDTADNIPGVVGVGRKNALFLIQQYGNIKAIYNDIDSLDIKSSIKKKLIEGKDSAHMSYKLGKIYRNVPIDSNIENYVLKNFDINKAINLMEQLELFSLIEKLEEEEIFFNEVNIEPIEETFEIIYEDDFKKLKSLLLNKQRADFTVFYKEDSIAIVSFIIEGSIFVLKKKPGFEGFFKEILEDENIEKRVHDSKRLFNFAENNGIDLKNIVFDTMLAGYLLNPSSQSYDLERLYLEYGDGENLYRTNLFDDELLAIKQAKEFSEIVDKLSEKIEQNEQTFLLQKVEIPAAKILSNMENIGFSVDEIGIQKYGDLLSENISNLEKEIYELIGCKFNIKSTKQLGKALFEFLGLPHGKATSRGYSTNAETLEKLRFMHPAVEKVLKFRTMSKIKSTYCDGILKILKEDGRIHTNFNQTETRTGRLSSTEPNLQNIPIKTEIGKELRKFFRAREGWLLVDADYSQIELRVLADLANEQNMIAAFKNNEDIHAITASQVFNMPLAMVTPIMRNRAKAVNFGIIYGIGAFSLSKDISISREEADDYINQYFYRYSGIKNYIDEILELARESGYVETKFGRRRYLPEISSKNFNLRSFGERVAINMPIQGTAADIIKIAMIRVAKRFEKENLKARLVLQVHDELLVEAPREEADIVAKLLKEEMEEAVELRVPLIATTGIGKTWYEAKK